MDVAHGDQREPVSGSRLPSARPVDPDQVRAGWSHTWLGIAIVSFVLSIVALVILAFQAFFGDAEPVGDSGPTAAWVAATAAWLLFVFSIVSVVVAWRRKR